MYCDDDSGGKENGSPLSELKVEVNRDSERMRQELIQYLNEFREKRGEDGTPLVHFPQNFDAIAEAMSRKDLISTDENPWSKYLLQETFDKDVESAIFEGGRYRDIFAEAKSESAVQRGLAEIQMLDKQLFKIAKRARDINHDIDEADGLTARSDTPGSGRAGKLDGTFLTRFGGGGPGSSAPPSVTDESPQLTGRSDIIHSARSNKSSITARRAAKQRRSGEQNVVNPAEAPATDRDDMEKEVGYSDEDASGIQQDPCTKEAAELRIKSLLDEDDIDGSDMWRAICRYGYTEEQLNRIEGIDSKLAEYEKERLERLQWAAGSGHSEGADGDSVLPNAPTQLGEGGKGGGRIVFPPIATATGGVNSGKGGKGKITPPPPPVIEEDEEKKNLPARRDYLQEQRVAHVRKRYAGQIDSMLNLMSSQEIDLSGLVVAPPSPDLACTEDGFLPPIHNDPSNSRCQTQPLSPTPPIGDCCEESNGEQKSNTHSIYAVPSVESIVPNRPITMTEVGYIVEELCYADAATSLTPAASTTQMLTKKASRAELDRLLAGCRTDVDRLAVLRSRPDSSDTAYSGDSRPWSTASGRDGYRRFDDYSHGSGAAAADGSREGRGSMGRRNYEARMREYYAVRESLMESEEEETAVTASCDEHNKKTVVGLGLNETQITEELRRFQASLGGGSVSQRPGSGSTGATSAGALSRMTAKQMKEARGTCSPTSTKYGLGALLDRRGSGSAGENTTRDSSEPTAAAVMVDLDAYQKKMNDVLDRAAHLHNMDTATRDTAVAGNGDNFGGYGSSPFVIGENGSALEADDEKVVGEEDIDPELLQQQEDEYYSRILLTRFGFNSFNEHQEQASGDIDVDAVYGGCDGDKSRVYDEKGSAEERGDALTQRVADVVIDDEEVERNEEVKTAPVIKREQKHTARF